MGEAQTMPGDATDPVELFLFIIVAGVVGGCAFIGTLEAWQRWSDNRRMRKLWSDRAKANSTYSARGKGEHGGMGERL